MARIGIDATSISLNGKGVSKYQRNMIASLSELGSDHDYYVFLNETFRDSSFIANQNWHFIFVPIWKALLWEQFQIPCWIAKLKLDLMQLTSERFPFLSNIPTALYLFENPRDRYRLLDTCDGKRRIYDQVAGWLTTVLFPKSLSRASCICVSSESTKKNLLEQFQVLPEKIRVVYPGREPSFRPVPNEKTRIEIRRTIGCPNGYVLHFATGDPRENTKLVVDSFEKAKGKLPPGLKLVIAGGGKSRSNFSENIIHLPFLTGTRLIETYQGASLYVDPSLYEGFGFQILEAMACGIPVISTQRMSIPEIVGEAGILLDPEDVTGFTQSMIQILTDGDLSEQMKLKGLLRAETFSWQKTARETLDIYNEILNEKQTVCYSS